MRFRPAMPILIVLLLVLATGCSDNAGQAWAPGLEETGFRHLDDTTDRAIKSLRQATTASGEQRDKALEETRQQLLALRLYYIPLTRIRQSLYDADRLDFNGDLPRAREHLDTTRKELLAMAEQNEAGVRIRVLELVSDCDELLHRLDLDGQPHKAAFDALVHQVNLLLTRGDLVLAGNRFP